MKKIIFLAQLVLSVAFGSPNRADYLRYFYSPALEEVNVSNWNDPSLEDYCNIQLQLNKQKQVIHRMLDSDEIRDQKLKSFFGSLSYRKGRIQLYSDKEPIQRVIDTLGNDPNQRQFCVVTYAGFPGDTDRLYTRGVELIRRSLVNYGFKGHFVYRVGGWPGLKKGRLKYADVPYAFKPFMIEEARDLGYKNILWLDCCVIPRREIHRIFEWIQTHGVCFPFSDSHITWSQDQLYLLSLMPQLGLDPNKRCVKFFSQVVGFNVDNPKANLLLDSWVSLACDRIPFLQSDEPPFGFLVNQIDLTSKCLPRGWFFGTPWGKGQFKLSGRERKGYLHHCYDYLNELYPVPDDIFK